MEQFLSFQYLSNNRWNLITFENGIKVYSGLGVIWGGHKPSFTVNDNERFESTKGYNSAALPQIHTALHVLSVPHKVHTTADDVSIN